jgi:hypothetical protein
MPRYYGYETSPSDNRCGPLKAPCNSRPYKKPGSQGNGNQGTQTADDLRKTPQARIDACKSRVQQHINRVNSDASIPAAVKTEMIKRLQAKLIACSTPKGVDDEEKDKNHNDVENLRKGQGKLVSQITPGKLRKNPDVLQSLIQAIYDFFKNITNRPEPVDRFLAKYPPQPPSGSG